LCSKSKPCRARAAAAALFIAAAHTRCFVTASIHLKVQSIPHSPPTHPSPSQPLFVPCRRCGRDSGAVPSADPGARVPCRDGNARPNSARSTPLANAMFPTYRAAVGLWRALRLRVSSFLCGCGLLGGEGPFRDGCTL
jgi:hypothetical protein